MEAVNGKNGKQIGEFFEELLSRIPKKSVKNQITGVKELIDALLKVTTKDFQKATEVLTEKNGKEIGGFFSNILKSLEGERDIDKKLKAVSKFVKELSTIGMIGAMSLMLLRPALNEKTGKAISGFISAIVKDMSEARSKQIETFAKSVKTLSAGMLILTATVGLVVAGFAVFGVPMIVTAMAVTLGFLAATLYIVAKLAKAQETIESASKSLMMISKALGLLVIDVLLLTAAGLLISKVDWESIGKIAVMLAATSLFVGLTTHIVKQMEGDGKKML